MAPALRLCLALECTARAAVSWRHTLRLVLEPILAMLEAVPGGAELALVLFGARPPHSAAAVESSLAWCCSVADFRQQLPDVSEFVGGGNQPVALAEALLEAAALFATAGGTAAGGTACQQHCLVCLASDPDTHPVPWPFAEDCSVANLPGLATSAELAYAFRRRGILLSLAGPNLLSSAHQFWHVGSLLSDVPLSLSDSRWERLKRQGGDAVQQQLMRTVVTLPGGAGQAALPCWPQAAEALQRESGGKLLGAGKSSALNAEASLGPPGEKDDPAAKRARLEAAAAGAAAGGAGAGAGAGAGGKLAPAPQASTAAMAPPVLVLPSPEGPPVVQWTPPTANTLMAGQATPSTVPAASPGSFWEVLNAEILSPADEAGTAPLMPPPPAQQAQQQAQQAQQGHLRGPAVPGLPLPPVQQQPQQQQQMQQQQQQHMQQQQQHMQQQQQQQQHMQQQQMQQQQAQQQQQHAMQQQQVMQQGQHMVAGGAPAGMAGMQPGPAGQAGAAPPVVVPGPNKYTLIHTARVVVDAKVMHGNPLVLGMAQVYAGQQDAPALMALSWPPELHIVKTIPLATATKIVQTKPGCRHARIKLGSASAEAAAFPGRLLDSGGVGVVTLQTSLGMLLPARHQQSQQVMLQLVVVPNIKAS